jgi:hypothetical protein
MGDRAKTYPFELDLGDRIACLTGHPALNVVLGVLVVVNGCWGACCYVDVFNGRLPRGALLDAPPATACLPI